MEQSDARSSPGEPENELGDPGAEADVLGASEHDEDAGNVLMKL
jgi:hypothetical protein